jgi:lysozyme family protein
MSFESAWKFTNTTEGGYVWDKADPGGETYRGITRRDHPKWPGWPRVDEAKTRYGYQPEKITAFLAGDRQLDTLVELLYREKYWDPLGDLPDLVKQKTFDIAVNAGQSRAVKTLQQALNGLGAALKVDGKLGPATRGAIEGRDLGQAVLAMCGKQADYYKDLVRRKPELKKFLRSWLARAKWVPEG